MAVKLIAFDLDFTLLNSKKEISAENLNALKLASCRGINLVPATGRMFNGLPAELKELPGLRWCILGNGAGIYDAAEGRSVRKCEIPIEKAFEIFDLLDELGLPYDCYAGGSGWMECKLHEKLDDIISDRTSCAVIRSLRQPVEDLREYLKAHFDSVVKIQVYFSDNELRLKMLRELPDMLHGVNISSSLPFNMEINSADANKGNGLKTLCGLLGLELSETMAFGDGLNDMEMIESAGIGVAMANAEEKLKAEADYITGSCDESGVAQAIRYFIPEKESK